MNPRLLALHPYPFERLARLKSGATPPAHLKHIAMSIGEPQHAPPEFVLETLRRALDQLGSYPATAGLPQLRAACAAWLTRRYGLKEGSVDPESMVLPVNGTREALFAFVQAAVDQAAAPLVALPNPFYQIYEGAAVLAGAEPYFIDTPPESAYQPELAAVPEAVWARCQVLFLCSPGNPTGAVLPLEFFRRALDLAERYDFIVASDECYADIYRDEAAPPPGLLEAAESSGRTAFERCVVFHSLSKRSSLPGLRSGFVAGSAALLERFLLYRTYHGGAMPVPTQLGSIAAWDDDEHACANRRLYQEKFARVLPLLAPALRLSPPAGAFYLWAHVGCDDEEFARELYARQNVTVLPGSYLSRAGARGNPGAQHVRISLVPPVSQCVEAAERILELLRSRPTPCETGFTP
ncbi:MAG TPA: succinyldiaminopimelate transaminase [Steroidobacteraceae bacterium]|nr:succinyldiaminopimelate transaminase [Steroidobacteraceae bacterium]